MLDADISVEIPFFVFFPERSGSTFLVHLLNAHPEVHCEHELFFMKKAPDSNRLLPGITDENQKVKVLERIFHQPDFRAGGFKFKFQQYDVYPEVYRFLLRNMGSVRQIFLYRRNLLKTAISRQNLGRLKAEGDEHYLRSGDDRELGKLHLDLEQARRYMNWSSRELDFFKRASAVFEYRLEIAYEDLVANPVENLNTIFEFLGVSPMKQDLVAPTKKITDDDLRNAVSNYEEMVRFFENTRFAGYLDQ